ncbi:hypothetical protein F5X99DRAFT_431297 [Biscogniauxia marginata]|nr:hypothetical protein F5X99DRAFT_431297 [Biscogniauxia marginata]
MAVMCAPLRRIFCRIGWWMKGEKSSEADLLNRLNNLETKLREQKEINQTLENDFTHLNDQTELWIQHNEAFARKPMEQHQTEPVRKNLANGSQQRNLHNRGIVELNELDQTNRDLRKIISDLYSKNKDLQATIETSKSHIFSLQSYRAEITLDEAGQVYKELIRGVSQWVDDWIDPILENTTQQEYLRQLAIQYPVITSHFKTFMEQHKDIKRNIGVSDIDHDILIASIIRFLLEKVFSTTLCGVLKSKVKAVRVLEKSMQDNIKPKIDLFAIRTWRVHSFNALIAHPQYIRARQLAVTELSDELCKLLLFVSGRQTETFTRSIKAKIVEPALRLHERFLTATSQFYLPLGDQGFRTGQKFDGELSDGELSSYLRSVECVDIAKCNRKFTVEKLRPIPSSQEIRENLWMVCSVHPALMVKEVGKRDEFQKPKTLYKEKILVAWMPGDVGEKLSRRPKSWLHNILMSS